MTTQFLIGPINDGLRRDVKPFAIPEEAFADMLNFFQWRGRVKRRLGYRLLGRLSINVPNTVLAASAQNFSVNIFTALSITAPTANIVPGSMTITVNGATYTLSDNGAPGVIFQTGGAGVAFLNGNINYLTSVITLNFSANPGGNVTATFNYAINQPVMGLRTREITAINADQLIAFDQTNAYLFSNTLNQFDLVPSVMPTVWSGTNYQFFFSTNYAGAFWATNSVPGLQGAVIDPAIGFTGAAAQFVNVNTTAPNNFQIGDRIYFLNVQGAAAANNLKIGTVTIAGNPFTIQIDGTVPPVNGPVTSGIAMASNRSQIGQDGIRYYTGTTWVNYNPPITAVENATKPNFGESQALVGALLIVPYRGYLVFLNTTEGNDTGVNNFPQRARWTQLGTPYYSTPVPSLQTTDLKAARSDIFGRGGFEDAPTDEEIVTAGFIGDILVVCFENTTWRLRFTQNSVNPFVWERINVELGMEGTFSAVVFDQGLVGIGERGIIIANATNVQRIDNKIPDEVFNFRNSSNGPQRIHGIRTFRTRLLYWTIPTNNTQSVFPNRTLVYNYDTKNWSFFKDSFTCFGYFQPFNDTTWAQLTQPWSSYTDTYWSSGPLESFVEDVVAGNQQGFVEIIESGISNDIFLNITGITAAAPGIFTCINHNLENGDWIKLLGVTGTTSNDLVSLNFRNFKVVVKSRDTFALQEFEAVDGGTALMGATSYTYTLDDPFLPIYPTSVKIDVGSIEFLDIFGDGRLIAGTSSNFGTINYETGTINLTFNPALPGTVSVTIRVVAEQPFNNVATTGTYAGGGYVVPISNFDVKSKIFNFFQAAQKTRLHKVDFYIALTQKGEFTTDVFGDSNTTIPINTPFTENLRTNVVVTRPAPYQIGDGSERIYRLFCEATAQTFQLGFRLSDQQMAVDTINSANVEINAMMIHAKPAGRLI